MKKFELEARITRLENALEQIKDVTEDRSLDTDDQVAEIAEIANEHLDLDDDDESNPFEQNDPDESDH